ncbi:MAG TPA: hypothetical protein VLR94_08495 [Acidobacteriota bacterium]|nr:hypothetical protein [Acidobacteriota bacterium]
MSFQQLLDQMSSVRGVEAVAFLDSQGELILHSGAGDPERLRVVGAYQGLSIGSISKLGFENARTLCTLYSERSILTQTLKDGYFICVIFSPDLNFAFAQFVIEEACRRLEDEL